MSAESAMPELLTRARHAARAGRRNRSYFRLPQSGTLYLCPRTLFKLHPDCDPLMRGILERDARGYLVLLHGQYAEWEAALRERFAVTLGALADRHAADRPAARAAYTRDVSLHGHRRLHRRGRGRLR